MPLEIERKWICTGGFDAKQTLAALRPLASATALQPVEQQDRYYDTEDLQLARAGLSARCRLKKGQSKLYLKPIPLLKQITFEREEIASPVFGTQTIGAAIHRLVTNSTALKLAAMPIEQLQILTHRTRYELSTPHCRAEMCLDQCQVACGDHSAAFTELELELCEGARDVFEMLADKIELNAHLSPSSYSKYMRARCLLGLEVPKFGHHTPLFSPGDPVGNVAPQLGLALWRSIQSYRAGTILGLDSEYLHKMRVSTRRLRAVIRTFHRVFTGEEEVLLRGELKWLTDKLGEVRDLDIRLQRLAARCQNAGEPDVAGLNLLRQETSIQRTKLRENSLIPALESARFAEMAGLAETVFCHRQESTPIKQFATGAITRQVDGLKKTARHALLTHCPHDIHRVRIQNKKLRYTCEIFAPVLGTGFEELVANSEALQDELGDFNDATIFGHWAQERLKTAQEREEPPALIAALEEIDRDCQTSSQQSQWHIETLLQGKKFKQQLKDLIRLTSSHNPGHIQSNVL